MSARVWARVGLGAALVACGGAAPTRAPDAGRSAAAPDGAVTAPAVRVELDRWSLTLGDEAAHGVAAVDDALYVVTARQRLARVDRGERSWDTLHVISQRLGRPSHEAEHAGGLHPGDFGAHVALARSGDRVLAAWTDHERPGNPVIVMRLGDVVSRALAAPAVRGKKRTPVGAPHLAPRLAGGWLVCVDLLEAGVACAAVDGAAAAGAWQVVGGDLQLMPVSGAGGLGSSALVATAAGTWLFATRCAPGADAGACPAEADVAVHLDDGGARAGAAVAIPAAQLVYATALGPAIPGDPGLLVTSDGTRPVAALPGRDHTLAYPRNLTAAAFERPGGAWLVHGDGLRAWDPERGAAPPVPWPALPELEGATPLVTAISADGVVLFEADGAGLAPRRAVALRMRAGDAAP